MALARGMTRAKKERKAIYFDLLCGVTSSVIAISGLIFVAVVNSIKYLDWFIVGVTFWVGYLIFSILMISYGIYSYHLEKHWEERKSKHKLRAPIV